MFLSTTTTTFSLLTFFLSPFQSHLFFLLSSRPLYTNFYNHHQYYLFSYPSWLTSRHWVFSLKKTWRTWVTWVGLDILGTVLLRRRFTRLDSFLRTGSGVLGSGFMFFWDILKRRGRIGHKIWELSIEEGKVFCDRIMWVEPQEHDTE